jgi:hypothetical protein
MEDETIQIKQKSTGKTYTVAVPAGWSDQQVQKWFNEEYLPSQKPQVLGSRATGSELSGRNAARAFAQGGTFGFQDELQAALGAGLDVLGGNIQPGGFGDQYRFLRDQERRDQERFAAANPKTNLALQVAGGAAIPVGAAGNAARAGTLGWGTLAKTGAKLGAVAGLGTSEAELTDPTGSNLAAAALDTGVGAGVGAGLGVALPWTVQQGVGALQSAGRAVGDFANRVAPQAAATTRNAARQTLGRLGIQQYLNRVGQATQRPSNVGPAHQRSVDRLEELGYEVTPGVRMNDRQLRDMEAMHRSNPFSPIGARLWDANQRNARLLNRQSAERIGLYPTDELSDVSLGVAKTRLNQGFEAIKDSIPPFKFDSESRVRMNRIMARASDPASPKRKVMGEIRRLQQTQDFNGSITGARALELRSRWSKDASAAYRRGEGEMGELYNDLVMMLDERVGRAVDPGVQPAWSLLRRQWKDLLVLKGPGVVTKNSVNPAALNQSLRRIYRDRYALAQDVDPVTGRGDDWFDAVRGLANASDMIGDSGTATRLSYMQHGAGLSLGGVAALSASRASAPVFGGAYMQGGHTLIQPPSRMAKGVADRLSRPLSTPALSEGKRYLDEEVLK